jgi:hypothetical protein
MSIMRKACVSFTIELTTVVKVVAQGADWPLPGRASVRRGKAHFRDLQVFAFFLCPKKPKKVPRGHCQRSPKAPF